MLRQLWTRVKCSFNKRRLIYDAPIRYVYKSFKGHSETKICAKNRAIIGRPSLMPVDTPNNGANQRCNPPVRYPLVVKSETHQINKDQLQSLLINLAVVFKVFWHIGFIFAIQYWKSFRTENRSSGLEWWNIRIFLFEHTTIRIGSPRLIWLMNVIRLGLNHWTITELSATIFLTHFIH